jgi:hypothetical protein
VTEDEGVRTPIEAVLEGHGPELLAVEGVLGAAVGDARGEPCILVFVRRDDQTVRSALPVAVEGYPLVLCEEGGFRAQAGGSAGEDAR